jgi:membrane-associated phospholipid phosphatase
MESTLTNTIPAVRARRTSGSSVPVLESAPDGAADRFASALGWRHPALVFLAAALGGLLLIIVCSIAAAYLLTDVIGHAPVIGSANRHFDTWLSHHRTANRTEASLIGSIAAGGVVLPIVAGLVALVCVCLRKWRIAAFAVFALAIESSAYRATTLVFHEHRPRVHRLENLPVDASYPSGHTAASIAVYGGLVLLLTSRIRSRAVRAVAWSIAVAIPIFVALSRMYRGMHYPLDVTGGALVGIAALCVVVFAARAAGAADRHRRVVR